MPTLDVFDGRGFVACLVGVALSNSGCGCRLVGASCIGVGRCFDLGGDILLKLIGLR